MKKLLIIVPLLLLSYAQSAFAQAELRVDPRGETKFYYFNGFSPGKQFYVEYYIINSSTTASDFPDTFYTHIRVNKEEIDSQQTIVTRSLTPYFSKKDSFHVITGEKLPSTFKAPPLGSPVVIVIWPTGNGFKKTMIPPFKDSFSFTYTGIAAVSNLESYLNIYPNPANDIVHFDIQKQGITLSNVEVCDVSGRIISEYINDVKYMDASMLPKGFYILNLHFSDGSTGRYKLIHN